MASKKWPWASQLQASHNVQFCLIQRFFSNTLATTQCADGCPQNACMHRSCGSQQQLIVILYPMASSSTCSPPHGVQVAASKMPVGVTAAGPHNIQITLSDGFFSNALATTWGAGGHLQNACGRQLRM
eukprot:1161854-Pelagomonas_calceolata.AAC.4